MKKLFGILGIGAGLAALVGGGLALAKNHKDGVELESDRDDDDYEVEYDEDETEE